MKQILSHSSGEHRLVREGLTAALGGIATAIRDDQAPNKAQMDALVSALQAAIDAITGGTDVLDSVTAFESIVKGLASTEGFGLLSIKTISASVVFDGGATETISIQIPLGVKILGTSLRNDTILVGAGAVTYTAAYTGGSGQNVKAGIAFAKNTKANKCYDANSDSDITTDVTDIELTPDAGTLDTGTVTAVTYYLELTSLTDAV
jgi:hypothetical protein